MCLNDGKRLKSRQFKPYQSAFSGMTAWVRYLLRCYEKSGLGVKQTSTIAETTRSLIQSFEQVAMRLNNSESAISQQHQGVEELEQSVNEIYNALELSRAAVENSHSMAEQLSVTADKMMNAVSGFTLPLSSSTAEKPMLIASPTV